MAKSNNPNIAEEGKPHRWKKGQSGNPSGRPKSKTLSDAYRNKLEEPVPNDLEGRTWAELIAEAQVRDVYDAVGHCVEKNYAGGYLDYLYDLAGNVEGEWDIGPNAHYIYMDGQLVAEYCF